MPENKTSKEILIEGSTTVTPSSDEAISAGLDELRRQIHGIADPEITLEGDQLLVIPAVKTATDDLAPPSLTQKQIELTSLAPNNVIRLIVERDQITAARNAGVPKRKLPQLKQLLRAA
ncbi:hypothetical protein A2693_01965 [Candidatus Curtissbacteria bacterium RIFCSPHIGHO2_01_FULL_40_12]|uniref:Uncharacterized protein n=1 Tax=Candidatus Curtissbacteria bacterium RIFCSPHIGHO2_01_FULL_40_12 TaxID=1797710 RepID=A0A1F5GCQ3_9BACT|nr:MAG: hypothetical protein A2693_01965 [Candidatus Curtissbacteria bacterium RIFCSPHIGHO2_01_FULL_40_12]